MADLTTTSDYINYVLGSMNELTDGTSPYEASALAQMNHVYRLIYAGGGELNSSEKRKPTMFPWAKAQYPLVINTNAPIEDGTVNVTLNSTAVVFSIAPTQDVTGWYLKTPNEPEVYRIATHTAGNTNATLDSLFVGATNTASAFTAFKTRYTIGPSVLGFVTPIQVFSDQQTGNDGRRQIDIIGETEFDGMYPQSLVQNEFPTKAKVVYSDSNGNVDIELNSYSSDPERLVFPYVRIPTALNKTGSDPILPIQWRPILAEYTLLFMYRDSNDTRVSNQASIAKSKFEAVISEAEGITRVSNGAYGRLYPRGHRSQSIDSVVKTRDGFILTG